MVRCTVARATRALDSLRATHCRLTRRVTSSLSEHLMLGLCHTPHSDQLCTKGACRVATWHRYSVCRGHQPCCKRLRQETPSPTSKLPGRRPEGDLHTVIQGNLRSPASPAPRQPLSQTPAGLVASRATRTVLHKVPSLRGASEATYALSNGDTPDATGATDDISDEHTTPITDK